MKPQIGLAAAIVAVVAFDGPAAVAQHETNDISGINVAESADDTVIRVEGDLDPTYSVFMLNAPPRLFVDISNSRPDPSLRDVIVANGVVTSIGVEGYDDDEGNH